MTLANIWPHFLCLLNIYIQYRGYYLYIITFLTLQSLFSEPSRLTQASETVTGLGKQSLLLTKSLLLNCSVCIHILDNSCNYCNLLHHLVVCDLLKGGFMIYPRPASLQRRHFVLVKQFIIVQTCASIIATELNTVEHKLLMSKFMHLYNCIFLDLCHTWIILSHTERLGLHI